MPKKNFIFRFWQNEKFFYLSSADGYGFYVRWNKEAHDEEEALKQADQHVGQILRNQSPHRIKYVVEPYNPIIVENKDSVGGEDLRDKPIDVVGDVDRCDKESSVAPNPELS